MSRHNESWMAKCPYYKWDDRQSIVCEGVQSGSAIHLAFDTSTNKKAYFADKCCSRYGGCWICLMNDLKWDRMIEKEEV